MNPLYPMDNSVDRLLTHDGRGVATKRNLLLALVEGETWRSVKMHQTRHPTGYPAARVRPEPISPARLPGDAWP